MARRSSCSLILSGIFEPFKQGSDIPQSPKVNVGLGLYIVKNIVEAHDGTVDVCSRDDKGTSFVVKLPAPHVGPPPERLPRGSPPPAAFLPEADGAPHDSLHGSDVGASARQTSES